MIKEIIGYSMPFVAVPKKEDEKIPNNVIRYYAPEKLAESTSSKNAGLHTDAFNTTIKSHTFKDGIGIIEFEEDVTNIKTYAFYNANITGITLPDSLVSLDGDGYYYGAFSGCELLTSIVIPDNVTNISNCTFSGCTQLSSIYIGKGVINILGERVFVGCSSLSSIVVDKNNPVYDSRNNCNAIIDTENNILVYGFKTTIIPNNVEIIGDHAFYLVRGLTNINIPDSVITIGDSAFYYSDLENVTLSESLLYIGNGAFSSTKIESIDFPNTLLSIGSSAFSYTNLSSIVIPESVLSIGEWAFGGDMVGTFINNSDLDEVANNYWGANIVDIIDGFYIRNGDLIAYKGSASELIIPDSVTSIGTTIYGSIFLTSLIAEKIVIPSSVTQIRSYSSYNPNVFNGISCTEFINNSNCDEVLNNYWGAFIYDEYINGLYIKDNIIVKADLNLTTVNIPNTVTGIGENAFKGCYNITEITVPENVYDIARYAFNDCNNLTTVTMLSITSPTKLNSSDSVGGSMIIYVPLEALTDYRVSWPNDRSRIKVRGGVEEETRLILKYIVTDDSQPTRLYNFREEEYDEIDMTLISEMYGRYAFSSIEIDDISVDITSIDTAEGYYLLSSGEHIIKYTLLNYYMSDLPVTDIHTSLFSNCPSLTEIVYIPYMIKEIGNAAFYNDNNLSKVIIPRTVIAASNYSSYVGAFDSCSNLKSLGSLGSGASVEMSKDTSNIYRAFSNSGLETVVLPYGIETISSEAFRDCRNLTSVSIPDTVTTISSDAFYSCRSLSDINDLNNIVNIYRNAFGWCSNLVNIVLGDKIERIDYNAFSECANLLSITINATTPPLLGSTSVFNNTASEFKIYVPAESVEAYKTANNWSYYASKIEPIL